MPLSKGQTYTSADYWNLPEDRRAELIGGQLYDMAPPSRMHQRIISQISRIIGNHIESQNGSCEVYPSPFAVNPEAADKDWVEPDISVICDKNKLTDRGCSGAPDLIVEVVSPSSRRMDYSTKMLCIPRLASGNTGLWIQRKSAPLFTIMKKMRPRPFIPSPRPCPWESLKAYPSSLQNC